MCLSLRGVSEDCGSVFLCPPTRLLGVKMKIALYIFTGAKTFIVNH